MFFVPDEPLGLGGQAAQIALAVVAILTLPIAVALALLRPGKHPRPTPAIAPREIAPELSKP